MARSPRAVAALTVGLALGLVLALGAPSAGAAESQAQIIVKRKAGLSASERGALRGRVGARLVRALALPRTEVVRVPAGEVEQALRELNADSDVVYAERDVVYRTLVDPREPEVWGLDRVNVQETDGVGTGAGVIVAVVDSGLAFSHDDAPEIATNPGETGGGRQSNGIDDDGNGLVDDYRGWNWPGDNNNPADDNGHGSHVAGTLAAPRNGLGIAGVAPDARVLVLKALNAQGESFASEAAEAFEYAGRLGIRIVNASFGGGEQSQTLENVMRRHPNTLFVAASGNVAADNDSIASYPCNSTSTNVICVGASDQTDSLAFFSNTGRRTVDLFAPGVDVLSLLYNSPSGYVAEDGTSMSSPFVAGGAAVLLGANPALTTLQLKNKLLAGVDAIPGLAGRSVTGGRLNVRAALDVNPGDADADGIGDAWDVCPNAADANQLDSDNDGPGDACEDGDGDGIPDARDACPTTPVPGSLNGCADTLDSDQDGVFNVRDACPTQPGPGTEDGCPRPATTDTDGDGVSDANDRCRTVAARTQTGCPKPVLRSLSARRISCRSRVRGRRCIRISVRVDRAATVRVTVQQRRCRGRRCSYRSVTTRTITVRRTSGGTSVTLRSAGRYRLRGVATAQGERSTTRFRSLRVR